MKKILILALLASLCLLCGCKRVDTNVDTQVPTVSEPTDSQSNESEPVNTDWELPVDVEENLEETEAVTDPAQGEETEPGKTEATKPQESTPSESTPQETQPKETQPEEIEPEETKSDDGAIVLPYIPG